MNIFYLDQDYKLAAQYHNDRHCVKMILETCQLLCTACHVHGVVDDKLYKQTHLNHPSTIWVRDTQGNYKWAIGLLRSLLDEYTTRYNKSHKCEAMYDVVIKYVDKIPKGIFYRPPKCMPDDCKSLDVVESYRKYYMTHKRHIASWKTQQPYWFK